MFNCFSGSFLRLRGVPVTDMNFVTVTIGIVNGYFACLTPNMVE